MARLYGLLLLLWVAPFLGCSLAPPKPEDWKKEGRRTPEQTFLRFQIGLRTDDPNLEYSCLAYEFKRDRIQNQAVYREAREELFRRQPFIKLAATAEVLETEYLPGGRARLTAKVSTWLRDETFYIEFVREEYYEVYEEGELAYDDFADMGELVAQKSGSYVAFIPDEDGIPLERISELRIGRHWLISGFAAFEDQGADSRRGKDAVGPLP